jgi:excisionase family DNA binding protein
MAAQLGISKRLLQKWVQKGIIPHVKIGTVALFDPAKVEAWLARFERKAR